MRDLSTQTATDLDRLIALVERLRAEDGCPWDRKQTLSDLRAYLLEEAHEVAAAIDSSNWAELAGELGDLLFQVAFISRLAVEAGAFAASEPFERVARKMIDRHPHVFGTEVEVGSLPDAQAVHASWERRKLAERNSTGRSLLDGATSASLPALVAAFRLTQKAAGVGFDWPNAVAVLGKVDEELTELRAELESWNRDGKQRVTEELGDLLFALANLARHLEVDPEAALAAANLKFRRRFAAIEAGLAENGRDLAAASQPEMEALWQQAKRAERAG